MRPDGTYIDDLDYLSESGYQKLPGAFQKLDELKQEFAAKQRGTGQGFNNLTGGLALAAVAGLTVFFLGYNKPKLVSSFDKRFKKTTGQVQNLLTPSTIYLDTIDVRPENFTELPRKKNPGINDNKTTAAQETDTVMVVSLHTKLTVSSGSVELENEKLKFGYNYPWRYIQNLKVSNYDQLYFRKKVKNDLRGTSAEFAFSSGQSYSVHEEAPVYLHEELEDALRNFRKGDYGRSIYLFNKISAYNVNDVNCSFYVAMSYYHRGQFSWAVQYFDRCLENTNNAFAPEAMFYKALSLKQWGKGQEAYVLLENIAADEGFYASRAKEVLESF